MDFAGLVIEKPFASASKSAHPAVWLVTKAGEYKLEREGGNPFEDEELRKLVGRKIVCTGTVIGYVLRIRDWKAAD